jgi:hypothetical protein
MPLVTEQIEQQSTPLKMFLEQVAKDATKQND